MDALLNRVTQHAVNYAIRSGMAIATGYTIKQCGRLLQTAPDTREREEIAGLQVQLETKLQIISPAIDMIELITARGHTTLESAVSLVKDIRLDMQSLAQDMNIAAEEEDLVSRKSKRANREAMAIALAHIIKEMKMLIAKIDAAVPLVNLAITTSGVNLATTKLSTDISPSRLLQASTFLTAADASYASTGQRTQVGRPFLVSVYMLFAGHARAGEGNEKMIWKEAIHKAHVTLFRVPLDENCGVDETQMLREQTFRASRVSGEFAYQLVIVEDFDDDRMHSFDQGDREPEPFDGVQQAGIREVIPVHQVSKLVYANTSKLLNIRGDDETTAPVLLVRRDINAEPPRRMMHDMTPSRQAPVKPEQEPGEGDANKLSDSPSCGHSQLWTFPADLDPEWLALEVYDASAEHSDDDVEDGQRSANDWAISGALAALSLRQSSSSPAYPQSVCTLRSSRRPGIKTSLSLLEMLLKLTALQQFRQEPHLSIEDELLHFFLEEQATAGSDDKNRRQAIRQAAVKKVGFDPYDQTPAKHDRQKAGPEHQTGSRTVSTTSIIGPRSSASDSDVQDDKSSSLPKIVAPDQKLRRSPMLQSQSRVHMQTPSRSSSTESLSPTTTPSPTNISHFRQHVATPPRALRPGEYEDRPASL